MNTHRISDGITLNRVDSEIALTALLAAAVTGYPSPEMRLYPYVKLTAVGLLALTLAKRVGILNGRTSDDRSLLVLTYLMEPATYVSFLYLCLVVARWVGQTSADLTPETRLFLFGGVAVVAAFGLFLASEIVFGASLREGERIFAASAEQHRGEAFGVLLRRIAGFVGASRVATDRATNQSTLTESRFYDLSPEDYSEKELLAAARSLAVMLASIGLAVGSYLLLLVAGGVFFDVGWFLSSWLLLTVAVVSAYFRIWYSNYGLVSVEDHNGFVAFLGDAVTFLVTGLLVL